MERDFSVVSNVQTGYGAYPASYTMGSWGCFPGVKWQGHEADHSLSSNAEVKNGGAMLPFFICRHVMVLDYLSPRITYLLMQRRNAP
jgi:hypothetical protein